MTSLTNLSHLLSLLDMINVYERKVLRMILGPVNINGEWRIRFNDELYSMYKDATIVRKIKAQRLRWLGRIARMDADDVPRKIFDTIPQGGQRGRGMPRLQWQDSVLADVKYIEQRTNNRALAVTQWRQTAKNRGK